MLAPTEPCGACGCCLAGVACAYVLVLDSKDQSDAIRSAYAVGQKLEAMASSGTPARAPKAEPEPAVIVKCPACSVDYELPAFTMTSLQQRGAEIPRCPKCWIPREWKP